MKRWRKTGILIFLCFCFYILAGGKMQEVKSANNLKVMIPLMNDSGFISYEDGVFSGYYIDYLTEIAKYTSWEYELIPIEDYDTLYQISEAGDFDLMAGIVYGEDYDKMYFDYPGHTVGAKRYVLAAPKGTDIIPNKDYSHLRGIKIGIASNTGITELEERFQNFCHMYGIDCVGDQIETDENKVNFVHIDPSSWREKLASGEVDGLLASDAFCLSQDMYAVTTFGLDQIYFVVPNGHTEILEQLNDALEKISNFDSDYNDRLYEKYFTENLQNIVSFNEEETEFLKEEHVWRVSMLKNYAPYAYINDAGEAAGMITQVLETISGQTGEKIKFEYYFYDSIMETSEAVKQKECDISGISMYSLLLKRDSEERRSTSFYVDNFMYYRKNTQEKENSGEQIVMLPDLPATVMNSRGTREKIVTAPAEECLEQTEKGTSSYTVMLSRVGDYYKSYNGYTDLEATPFMNGDVMFCFAYSSEMPETVISIIDKCLLGLQTEELDNYMMEVSLFDYKKQTIHDYIKNNIKFFALLLAAILAVICALLIIIVINVTRNSRKIYKLLYQDDITGGMSYKKFMEVVLQQKKNAEGKPLMLHINISSFKYINDVFGYEQGNEVLRAIAHYLESSAVGACFARIYADRFVAFVSYQDRKTAGEIIRKSLDEFEEICRRKFPSFNIWIKVGAYTMEEGDDIQKAVNLANYAVDEIEKTSKNDYVFYDDKMYERLLTQKEIEKDMRAALENGEFVAYYQPKYNIETKELVGAEALVRWKHSEKGLLPPGVFIPIFERNHFIIQIDFYVFERICAFQQAMRKENRVLFPISSNFSRLHLNQPRFVETLMEIVERYQVSTKYLEIEITETVAEEDFDLLVNTVKSLKEYGFLVSIDDFGSGYSSIQLLYKLPIDVLKLDKTFVDNGGENSLETELVDSIISISHKNGIRIICEGVETLKQEEFVRSHNCIFVQGYLYSKPVPEDEFKKLLVD